MLSFWNIKIYKSCKFNLERNHGCLHYHDLFSFGDISDERLNVLLITLVRGPFKISVDIDASA